MIYIYDCNLLLISLILWVSNTQQFSFFFITDDDDEKSNPTLAAVNKNKHANITPTRFCRIVKIR